MPIRPAALALLAFAATTVRVEAAEITLTVDGPAAERSTARYACDGGKTFSVDYVNAGETGLAVVPVDGKRLVFAAVLSGSGARYASGPYVWWSAKGGADLYDLRRGEDADPILHCEETAG